MHAYFMEDQAMEPTPPIDFADSNERGNDSWDHDAVCWMLAQLGSSTDWTYHNLFECARKQKNRLENDIDRVIVAANVCGRLGVQQIELRDPKIGKLIVRLRRTDPDAPDYPSHYDNPIPSPLQMKVTADDRAAAERLLGLLESYEAELVQSGKSRNTVHTYVDRTERFLKRVAAG